MSDSHKPESRSNLYRSRRKLLKGIDRKKRSLFDSPDNTRNWRKPIEDRGRGWSRDQFMRFTITSNPPVGTNVKPGDTIENIHLVLSPTPEFIDKVEYRIICGKKYEGPFKIPIDANGSAKIHIVVSSECIPGSSLILEYNIDGQKATAEWNIKDANLE
jgi:hypothetical protein